MFAGGPRPTDPGSWQLREHSTFPALSSPMIWQPRLHTHSLINPTRFPVCITRSRYCLQRSSPARRPAVSATGLSNPGLPAVSPIVDQTQTRKFSQPSFGMVSTAFSTSRSRLSSTSPSSGPAFSANSSRSHSGTDFVGNAANVTDTPHSGTTLGAGSDKGTKRTRNFTPVSANTYHGEEEETSRASPRVKIGPYGGRPVVEE